MNPKVRIAAGVRPPSALDRLSDSQAETGNEYLSIPTGKVTINATNVRNTFKSLAELERFSHEIKWPEDGLDGGLEDPIEWIERARGADDEQPWSCFTRIVKMALSIRTDGQLQPVGVVKEGNGYRVVLGSTRVMACWLLRRNVDVRVMSDTDALSELRAHLAENLDRENLSFAETAAGYLRLFDLLIEQGEIQEITRSAVMSTLNLSRTHALRWRSVLNAARSDSEFRDALVKGSIDSLNEAYNRTRPKPETEVENAPGNVLEGEGNPPAGKDSPDSPPEKADDNIAPLDSGNGIQEGNQHSPETSDILSHSEPGSTKEPPFFAEEAQRLSNALFTMELEYQLAHNPQSAERIRSYLDSGSLTVSSKGDALRHVQWLIDVVAEDTEAE